MSSDSKRLKLNLRKGVTFHDGREFTSDDVKWNFLRVRDPKVGAGAFVGQSNWFSSFDTPDKNTIILKSERAAAAGVRLLRAFEHARQERHGEPGGREGQGQRHRPFKLVEWVQGSHFQTVKNPNFWISGRPYIDGVRTLILRTSRRR